MKKIIIATAISLGIASSAWAAQTTMPEMDMSQHQQAITVHENMKNGNAFAHQQMVDAHKKMMGTQVPTETASTAKPFSAMNEHEQTAVAHEFTKNGQSGVHEQEAKQHLLMQAN